MQRSALSERSHPHCDLLCQFDWHTWIQILKDRLLILINIVTKECLHAAPVATAGDARIVAVLRMEDRVPTANQIGLEDARTKRNASETVTPLRFRPMKVKIPDKHRR